MLSLRGSFALPIALIVAVAAAGCSGGGTTDSLPGNAVNLPHSSDSTIQMPGSVTLAQASRTNVPAPSGLTSGTQSSATVPAFSLYDSVGVDTHLSRSNYRSNASAVTNLLANLGARHIREAINPSLDPGAMALQKMYFEQYGIDSTETTAGGNTVAMWAAYKNGIGAGMTGLEGANEPDNHQTNNAWIAPTLALQKQMWHAVHGGSAALAGLQVEGPSILNCKAAAAYGDQSAYADFSNMHRYFSGYSPDTTGWGGSTCGTADTYGSLGYGVATVAQGAASRPTRTTESSYCTAPVRSCVPQNVAAAYEPQIFTTSFLYNGSAGARIPRTYIYELVSESSTDGNSSLGLTEPNFSPKPMYYAVQGFIAHLKDTRGAATGSLTYNITGTTTGLKAIALRYSNGDYGMVLYTSTAIWQPNGGATSQGSPIAVPDDTIAFSVSGQTLNNLVVSTYDGSGRWRDSAPSSQQQIALRINAYMHILRWSAGSGATPPPTPTPTAGPTGTPAPNPSPTATVLPSSTPSPGNAMAIDAGGGATGTWLADTGFSGGHTAKAYGGTIDTSLVTNPAPQAVYRSARAGTGGAPFSYTLSGLGAGASHTVRLHFSDNYKHNRGDRVFSVAMTGTSQTLRDFDIIAQAGAPHKAIVVAFPSVVADSLGTIVVTFTPSVDDGYVNGIEAQ